MTRPEGKGEGQGEGRAEGRGRHARGATLALVVSLALALALPFASASRVELSASDGVWNGVSEADAQDGAARVWLPAGARVQRVSVDGAPASWSAAGPDALLVSGEGSTARVEFDYRAPPLRLARIVAQEDGALEVRVSPPSGMRVESDDITLREEAGEFAGEATLAAGASVTLRVVDAGRVGELPLLAALALLSLGSLAGAMLWHRVRPPAPRGSEMGFLDHLGELQARIVPPVVLFALFNVLFFVAGLRTTRLGPVPLVVPTFAEGASIAARGFDAIAERLVPEGVELVALRPVDAILAQVQVSLGLALLAVLPLLVYEIGAFVAPALEARERRVAARVLPLVGGLFVAGALFGFLAMAPLMMRTLYAFAPGVGALPLLSVGDLVSFALLIVLAFALAFQLPVLMFALSRFGVVQSRTWRRYLRHAVVVIFIAAGILTPDPSVVSQILVGLPVTALYAIGLLAAAWGERSRTRVRTPSAAA